MALSVGDVVGERYELEERLGAGGMGEVFRAHDRVLEREVAIKALHAHLAKEEGLLQRFRREARVLARVRNPGIITVYDMLPVEQDRLGIVLEYVPGRSLDMEIPSGGLPWRRCAEIGTQVASALGAAHEEGIVHRDVKPSNILVEPNGGVRVADFGIARLQGDVTMTRGGESLGTPAYMAPEQARGESAVPESDIYSLGAVLYNAATGSQPFQSEEGGIAAALAHLTQPVPDPRAARPDIPDAAAELIMRALSKQPAERFSSAKEMADALRASANIGEGDLPAPESAGSEVQGPPTPVEPPPGPPGATRIVPDASQAGGTPPPPPDPTLPPPSAGTPPPADTGGGTGGTPPPGAPPPGGDAGSGGSRRGLLIGGIAVVAVLVAVGIGLAVGGVFSGGGDDDGPEGQVGGTSTGEETSGPTTTEEPPPDIVIDDFEDTSSGFETFTEENGAARYRDGEFEIRLTAPNFLAVAESNIAPVADVEVSTVVRNPSAARDAGFGVVCRFVDDDNYYLLGAGRDGFYAITRWLNDEATVLTGGGQWTRSTDIPEDAPLYKVSGTCDGDRLTLRVNGRLIDSVQDSALSFGETGLFMRTFQAPAAVVRFDDFTQDALG
jgi:serine/threonine-protein kinase